MALDFSKAKGKAEKVSYPAYEIADGDNKLRMFGGILPRYVYWLKGTNNKDIPVECLSFDREKEKFTNVEEDPVPEYYPDKKCQWAYSINCIDLRDGKVKIFNLKKKLLEQIKVAAEDLGDPTDPQTGWDVVFKKVKTGPSTFNVEYTLQVLRCKPRPLTEAEIALINAEKTIDEKYVRPSVEDIKSLLERISSGDSEETPPPEAASDLAP